jgi:hydroxymethylbilane synthase
VRDALISAKGCTISTLPHGASVGTSSLRRASQILSLRPDIKTESLRGNVDTRLRKALDGQYDAIILAGAGLSRLGLAQHVTEWLSLDVMLPAPGQGALAIQCRADDLAALSLLARLEDDSTRKCVTAERAFLSGLGGGCSVPVAAHAQVTDQISKVITLTGLVSSIDGKQTVKVSGEDSDPLELGKRLANEAIAQGANEILAITLN